MGRVGQKISLWAIIKCIFGIMIILGAFYVRLHGQSEGWSNWAIFPVFVIAILLGVGLLSWEKPRR